MTGKPWSEACERNREPIFEVLREVFADVAHVLEIGSGTGQHAAFFAAVLPQLVWQASDRAEHLPGIAAWRDAAGLPNLRPPLALDVDVEDWPVTAVDGVFSANTLHIMSWSSVQNFFRGAERVLMPGGVLAVYGPFHYGGQPTADSNASFDAFLRASDPLSGIRGAEAVHELAARHGFAVSADHAMPANNRTLVWRRSRAGGGCQ
jgi:cyclopropane fatty-acyl-phospholipid synthase-like methyltransferase